MNRQFNAVGLKRQARARKVRNRRLNPITRKERELREKMSFKAKGMAAVAKLLS